MAQPVKPWLSIGHQIDRLQRRGMQISDEATAAQWLSAVGYYRLSGYWYPFREIDSTGQARRLSTFVPGTTFTEVVDLYEFDRRHNQSNVSFMRSCVHAFITRPGDGTAVNWIPLEEAEGHL